MTPRYLNLFLDVCLATFHLSLQILTPTLPCVTCGLMRKKCKDMVINFLKYQPTVITPIQLNGMVIDRVSSYKLLGLLSLMTSLGTNIVTVSIKKLLSGCLCCGPSRELDWALTISC